MKFYREIKMIQVLEIPDEVLTEGGTTLEDAAKRFAQDLAEDDSAETLLSIDVSYSHAKVGTYETLNADGTLDGTAKEMAVCNHADLEENQPLQFDDAALGEYVDKAIDEKDDLGTPPTPTKH